MEIRYCIRRDDDCHNYLIPTDLCGLFQQALDNGEGDGWATFNGMFEQYRIDSVQALTFTDPR